MSSYDERRSPALSETLGKYLHLLYCVRSVVSPSRSRLTLCGVIISMHGLVKKSGGVTTEGKTGWFFGEHWLSSQVHCNLHADVYPLFCT